jgi:hypothetical protein
MPDADLAVAPLNPEAIAYPTENIGGGPANGSTPGQHFPNLTLAGVRSAATVDTPAVVAMSEYYDPTGARYDLLHVIGVFFWCPHCNNESNGLMQIAPWRSTRRVAVLEIAMQGYGGESPGWSEVQQYATDHGFDFPLVVDGQGAALEQYFDVRSVPLNVVVNPRTMEILAVDVGEVGDVEAYEQTFLTTL